MMHYTKQIAFAALVFMTVACDQGRPGCPNCRIQSMREQLPSMNATHKELAGQLPKNSLSTGYALLPEFNVSHSLQEHMLQIQEQYDLLDGHNTLKSIDLNK